MGILSVPSWAYFVFSWLNTVESWVKESERGKVSGLLLGVHSSVAYLVYTAATTHTHTHLVFVIWLPQNCNDTALIKLSNVSWNCHVFVRLRTSSSGVWWREQHRCFRGRVDNNGCNRRSYGHSRVSLSPSSTYCTEPAIGFLPIRRW